MDRRPLEAVLRVDHPRPGWLELRRPTATLVAREPGDVPALLREVAAAVDAGKWAVGCMAYEAAPAFDRALDAHPPTGPVAVFGLYDEASALRRLPFGPAAGFELGPRIGSEDEDAHGRAVAEIRRRIARGDVYQVNHTLRLTLPFAGDAWSLFRALWKAQRGGHSAWLRHGNTAVCSASPELFFELADGRVTTRPMKGTAARSADGAEDDARAAALAASAKDRAENLMIVDMMRNDLGRVARPGTVRVPNLFEVETLPTVHQMTSTVTAETPALWHEVLAALFPAASITGAPKAAATEVIRELETAPRGVYTGTFGYVHPDGSARFSVAIRTAELDLRAGRAVYGTGGGIVWDSTPEAEYRECLAKARVLARASEAFELLETLRWDPENGFRHLEAHLRRLAASSSYFTRPFVEDAAREALHSAVLDADGPRRLRLRVDADGALEVEADALDVADAGPRRLAPARRPVSSADPWLRHKTSRRAVYDRARRERPDADDVILWNERREVTETSRANLALEIDGRWVTPPASCGLLPGVERASLLAAGRLIERVVPLSALAARPRCAAVSSLRGWMDAEVVAAVDKKRAGRAAGLRKKEEE